jgi:hypothetical protein
VLAIQVKCLQYRVVICVCSYMFAKVKVCLQIAFTLIVFPCLLLAYTGQAAYIISNKTHVADAFYRSIPGPPHLRYHTILFSSKLKAQLSVCHHTMSARCTLVA